MLKNIGVRQTVTTKYIENWAVVVAQLVELSFPTVKIFSLNPPIIKRCVYSQLC